MLTGGKGWAKMYKGFVWARPMSPCFCLNVHVFCVLICLSEKKKKKQSLHKGGRNPALSSETNDFHCKWCGLKLGCCIYSTTKIMLPLTQTRKCVRFIKHRDSGYRSERSHFSLLTLRFKTSGQQFCSGNDRAQGQHESPALTSKTSAS